MARRSPARRRVDDPPRTSKLASRRLQQVLLLAVVVAVGAGGFVVATRSTGPKFKTFHDTVGAFTVTYPANWIPYSTNDSNIRLFLKVFAESLDSVNIRVEPTQAVVDPSDLVYLKSVTDAIISGSHPNVQQQDAVTLNGLPGYYYRYTIQDQSSGQTLVHFHYFVFQAHKMLSLVLQALPSDLVAHGGRLANQFDQLRSTLHGTS